MKNRAIVTLGLAGGALVLLAAGALATVYGAPPASAPPADIGMPADMQAACVEHMAAMDAMHSMMGSHDMMDAEGMMDGQSAMPGRPDHGAHHPARPPADDQ